MSLCLISRETTIIPQVLKSHGRTSRFKFPAFFPIHVFTIIPQLLNARTESYWKDNLKHNGNGTHRRKKQNCSFFFFFLPSDVVDVNSTREEGKSRGHFQWQINAYFVRVIGAWESHNNPKNGVEKKKRKSQAPVDSTVFIFIMSPRAIKCIIHRTLCTVSFFYCRLLGE